MQRSGIFLSRNCIPGSIGCTPVSQHFQRGVVRDPERVAYLNSNYGRSSAIPTTCFLILALYAIPLKL
jgi:hypothetical protein